jgi:hypothetical protein
MSLLYVTGDHLMARTSQRNYDHTFNRLWIVTVFMGLLFFGVPPTAYAATLTVDVNDVTCNDTTGTPYCTIQAAIDDATPGDIITIAAGTYVEDIMIDKANLTLIGANDGNDPNRDPRGAETVVVPATTLIGSFVPHIEVTANASGTTFRGFTFDGSPGGTPTSEIGISNYNNGFAPAPENVDFRYNIMRGYNFTGFWFDNQVGGGVARNGFDVLNNLFEDMPNAGAAVMFRYEVYGTMRFNVVRNLAVGLRADAYNVDGAARGIISDNIIIGATNRAIWYNDFGGADDSGFAFENNTIIGPTGRGLNITHNSDNPPILRNNTIVNVDRGYDIWNSVDSPIAIEGGNITNAGVGIRFSDTTTSPPSGGSSYAGTTSANTLTVDGVGIFRSTTYGIHFQDSLNGSSPQRDLTLNVQDSTIRDGAVGIQVDVDAGAAGQTPGNQLFLDVDNTYIVSNTTAGVQVDNGIDQSNMNVTANNCFVGNAVGVAGSGGVGGDVNAQANWWGDAAGANLGGDTTTGAVNASSPLGISPSTICSATLSRANDDATSTDSETPITNFDIVANDTNVDPTSINIISVSSGAATSNGDGTINFTPISGLATTSLITYTAEDANGDMTNAAIVTVTIGLPPVIPTTATVTPSDLQGWGITDFPSSTAAEFAFVTGAGTPPLGTGSLEGRIPSAGSKLIFARTGADYSGTRVADLTGLSYSTYNDQAGGSTNNNNWYINLYVSTNGNADADCRLDFAPSQPTGNTWQTFDALAGTWLGNNHSGGTVCNPPSPPAPASSRFNGTLADFLVLYPNATLLAWDNPAAPTIVINQGDTSTTYTGYRGNFDAFRIATTTSDTTWDFEPDPVTTGDTGDTGDVGIGEGIAVAIVGDANILSASADTLFTGLGQTVNWTVTLNNTTGATLNGASISIGIDNGLILQGAGASSGLVSQNAVSLNNVTVFSRLPRLQQTGGGNVTWSQGSVAPGEIVTINITTQVANALVAPALSIRANLTSDIATDSAIASVLLVTQLPATGETPMPADALRLALLMSTLMASGAGLFVWRKRLAN